MFSRISVMFSHRTNRQLQIEILIFNFQHPFSRTRPIERNGAYCLNENVFFNICLKTRSELPINQCNIWSPYWLALNCSRIANWMDLAVASSSKHSESSYLNKKSVLARGVGPAGRFQKSDLHAIIFMGPWLKLRGPYSKSFVSF